MNTRNKNTPSIHHLQRQNVPTSMVDLKKKKQSHTQKISSKMVKPRDIAGNVEEEEEDMSSVTQKDDGRL